MRFTPRNLRPQIDAVARASARMSRRDDAVWRSRLHLVYGQMEGQRAVDFSTFTGEVDRHATIIALESIYYLITVLVSTSAFGKEPAAHLLEASRLPNRDLDRYLAKITSGDAYEDLGIAGCTGVDPMEWLIDGDVPLRDALRELMAMLARLWDGTNLKLGGDDPFQTIHHQLFPANLIHITGQFYSPPWLAELLLQDVGWTPDQSLIDPFCGSGVFLVKALRSALDQGYCPTEVLPQIVGMDIHPFAAAGARASLALFVARHGPHSRPAIEFSVHCGDAIAPSIQGPPRQGFASPVEKKLRDGFKADVVATNPPWVGWEYLSRPYRDCIASAWMTHDLYQSRGLEASFLKEDLSNLALLAAWDAYLRDGGRSVVVLRPSTMHSEVASRGVRRLALRDGGTELNLQHIRTFKGLRLFSSASTAAATWLIQKGGKTSFPVPVSEMQKLQPRWNPSPSDRPADVLGHVRVVEKVAEPTDADDATSRWMIASEAEIRSLRRLRGSNDYTPRMGVFTGGANAVFYLRRTSGAEHHAGYKNITANSKRPVDETDVDVEGELVHSVVRGRDVHSWRSRPQDFLLVPHTRASQMYPIGRKTLQADYPKTYRYFCKMKEPLRARNGFANWEKKIHQQHFYTLQRVGPYTFAPYKVCWRYIANEFTVCVLGSDEQGKTIVPNDKVMFIPMDDPGEAYFVAGFLSSDLVCRYVGCVIEKRQISTRVIKSLAIPKYDAACPIHQMIRDCCRNGHRQLDQDPDADVTRLRKEINKCVAKMIADVL